MKNNKTFLTVPDLAELTGESVGVWRKRILLRQIPIVKCGRNVRIQREDFDAFIASRRILSIPNSKTPPAGGDG